MKAIVVIAVSALAILGAVGTFSKVPQRSSEVQGVEPGTLKWHVKKAKEKGQARVVASTPVYNYAAVRSLEEALSYFRVAIVSPVEKKSYVQSERNVTTWYKFRVVEDLSASKAQGCSTCGSLPDPPAEMLPLKDDEILIPKAGGTVMLDGVEVIKEEGDFPQFSMSKEYLLFFEPDLSRGIARLSLGPAGVFPINPDGSLEGINRKGSLIKSDLEVRFNNSVNDLKAKLKSQK